MNKTISHVKQQSSAICQRWCWKSWSAILIYLLGPRHIYGCCWEVTANGALPFKKKSNNKLQVGPSITVLEHSKTCRENLKSENFSFEGSSLISPLKNSTLNPFL